MALVEDPVDRRTRVLAILTSLVFVLLVSRLWLLQVVQGNQYQRLADGNRIRLVRISAPRGQILDTHGKPIVGNRIAFTVSIVPKGLQAEQRDQVIKRLAAILNMTPQEITDTLKNETQRYAYEPVRLRRDVTPEMLIAIEEQRPNLPGVLVEEEPIRDYPYESLAGHLLGYLGPITREELIERSGEGYRGTDLIGKTGLERMYEKTLRGVDGGEQVEVNALNRPIRLLGMREPLPGNNVTLTIDLKVQEAAERALAEQILTLKESGKAKGVRGGVAVALDPQTGAVLAVANYPSFDPNRFIGDQRGSYYQTLHRDPLKPLLNRYITGQYNPASTFKSITAIAALEAGVVTPQEVYFADDFGPYGKRCWTVTAKPRQPAHGNVNLAEALAVSCNDYFWEMAIRTGIDRISQTARAFGLGAPTGIDFMPEEKTGLVPDREWKRQRFRSRGPSEQVWYAPETLDVSIGEGFILATPLQIAAAYMAFANQGVIYRPMLVREVRSPAGEMMEVGVPRIERVVRAKPETWEAVMEGLKQNTSSPKGTAYKAFKGFPIPVAGKSGSSQQAGGRDSNAVYVALAPADKPEIVVVVLLEQGGGGGARAAPVARKVLEAYFDVGPKREPTQESAASQDGLPAADQAPLRSPEGNERQSTNGEQQEDRGG